MPGTPSMGALEALGWHARNSAESFTPGLKRALETWGISGIAAFWEAAMAAMLQEAQAYLQGRCTTSSLAVFLRSSQCQTELAFGDGFDTSHLW